MPLMEKQDEIIVVGAGVFGLSAAWFLAKNGYTNVTVFDRTPYDQLLYDQDKGCDAASADINKVFRASYGDQALYQGLAYSARDQWLAWNQEIAATPATELPHGLSPEDALYIESSYLRLVGSQDEPLSPSERDGLSTLSPNNRRQNYIIDDHDDILRARQDGWGSVIENTANWKGTGVLDATAGYLRADKACIWLSHLARHSGVRFNQHDTAGRVVRLLREHEEVLGVETADGKLHKAVLTIVAGGGWTPSLVPEVRDLLETTAGSVVSFTIPSNRPDLLEKFSAKNWPVISHQYPEGIIYSLPQVNGVVKAGYRLVKFTNYTTTADGVRVSTPVTAYTTPTTESNVPIVAVEAVKQYVREHMPELVPFGISHTRLCWYTDSIDNHFLIDYVPGSNRSLFVASGGSGHGFKFAPVLGAHVVDALHHRSTEFTELWKWRTAPEGKRNGIEEGEEGPRVLAKYRLANSEDWVF